MRQKKTLSKREVLTVARRAYDGLLTAALTTKRLGRLLERQIADTPDISIGEQLSRCSEECEATARQLMRSAELLNLPVETAAFKRGDVLFQRAWKQGTAWAREASKTVYVGPQDLVWLDPRGRGDTNMLYDLFICHASEDKAEFVRPLADELISLGLRIWYDEFSLSLGDSLSQSVDRGLAGAEYGLVVLSPSFFSKNWTKYELGGLVAKEMQGKKVILPIWHRITRAEILNHTPALADKVALTSSTSAIPEMAAQIAEVVRSASPLS